MTNNSKNNNDIKKPSGRRNYITERNTKKWYQGTESAKGT